MKAVLVNEKINISFRYDPDMVQHMRGLINRKWNPATKTWECSPLKENIKTLASLGFDIDNKILNLLQQKTYQRNKVETKTLKKKMFPFQQEGLGFLVEKNGRALIADEMGLGKTIQALSYLELHPEIAPILIICPASLKMNWKKEIEECLSQKKKIHIVEGTKEYDFPKANIYICNYDIVSQQCESLIDLNPELIILDECHFIKSRKAKRTIGVQTLSKKIKKIIALTGTPVINRPSELFTILGIINPSLFPNFFHYGTRYCGMKKTKYGWDYSKATNSEELHEILSSSCMIRRTKTEVLPDLPAKIRTVIPLEINRKEYDKVENNFKQWLKKEKGKTINTAEALAQIEYLKQVCIKEKMKDIKEWVLDFLDQNDKLVLMATHRQTIEEMQHYLLSAGIKAVKLEGGMSSNEKQNAVEEFQNNPDIRVFIGNIKAAGVGITLTAASAMAILELPFSPGDLTQAEDRIHRIGAKECCNIYYFIATETIDETILKLIEHKQEIIAKILDGKDVEDENILSQLLTQYSENKE